MSVPTKSTATYVMKSDPIYDISHMLIKADQSTNHKQLRYVYPISTPSGSWASPLRQEAIDFDIRNETSSRIRFDTCMMFFELYIRNDAGNGNPVSAVPPPNLVARLINELSLKLNDGSDLVFNKDKSTFLHHFNATLLRTFPLETLSKRGDCIFTPIGSTKYTSAEANATQYDPAGLMRFDGTNVTGKLPLVEAAPNTLTALAASVRPLDGAQKTRFDNIFASANSYLRPIQMAVPFGLLFGISGIVTNLVRMMIRLTLAVDSSGNADLLEEVSADASCQGRVRVAKVWIGLDQYVPNVNETISQITDKKEGTSDILTYFDSDVKTITVQSDGSNEFVFTGIKDLQSVLLYQVAENMTNGRTAGDRRVYNSPFEFFFGNNVAPATLIVERSDHAGAVDYGIPFSEISIEYGSVLYPQQPIKTYRLDDNGFSVFLPQELFQEYLKATGRGGSWDPVSGTNFVDYNLFSRTMPFCLISPWANNGVHLTKEAKNLTIKLTRTSVINPPPTDTLTCVITRLRTITLASDTSVLVSS